MEIDLTLIGMEKGSQYETIITTINSQNEPNAAPMGVLCADKDRILNRIFKGSHTLENIIGQKDPQPEICISPDENKGSL